MKNKKVVRLTESQLHNIIAETVTKILKEVNSLTADSALAKAKDRYDALVKNGQGNTPQAAKLKQQIDTFTAYNDTDDENVTKKNAYGRTHLDRVGDHAKASGIEGTPQQVWDSIQNYYKNDKTYDGMNRRQAEIAHQANTKGFQGNTYDYEKRRFLSPEEMGYTYEKGKKGFLGIGGKKGGWRYNPKQS